MGRNHVVQTTQKEERRKLNYNIHLMLLNKCLICLKEKYDGLTDCIWTFSATETTLI